MKISMYQNHFSKNPSAVQIADVLDCIKNGRWAANVISLRSCNSVLSVAAAKKGLPCFTPSCHQEGGRGLDFVKSHSGLLLLDIDKKDNQSINLDGVRESIFALPYVFSLFTTCGGKGLAVICKIDGDNHKNSYSSLSQEFKQLFNINVDLAASDVPRLRAVSFDPQLLKKPIENVLRFERFSPTVRNSKSHVDEFLFAKCQSVVNQLVTKGLCISESRLDWINRAFEFASLGEKGRPLFHEIASAGSSYNFGVSEKKFTEAITRYREDGNSRSAASFLHYCYENHGITPNHDDFRDVIPHHNLLSDLYAEDHPPSVTIVKGLFIKGLPSETTLLNKGVTGNGATHTFITDSARGLRVLLVPYTSIIDSKSDSPNIIAVMAGLSESDLVLILLAYGGDSSLPDPTIVGTYDSLKKIIGALHRLGIPLARVPLMVDEWHSLVMAGNYRAPAIRTIMNNFEKFAYTIFVTATPIPRAILPAKLRAIRQEVYQFVDIPPPSINIRCCTDSTMAVIELVKKRINASISGEYHIFVNNISMIKRIYDELSPLSPIKVTFSKSREKELEGVLPWSAVSERPRQVNLYTSAAFDGFDIQITEDEYVNGRRPFLIAIADSSNPSSQLNLSIDLIQIAGRLRLPSSLRAIQKKELRLGADPFSLNFFFTPSKTPEWGVIHHHRQLLEDLELLHPIEGEQISLNPLVNPDYIDDEGLINLDSCRISIMRTASLIGYSGVSPMTTLLKSVGWAVKTCDIIDNERVTQFKKKISPNELINEFLDLMAFGETCSARELELITIIERRVGSVESMIRLIKEDELRGVLQWVQIKRMMITRGGVLSDHQKIYQLLKLVVTIGERYSANQIKTKLAGVYGQLGVATTPKGGDLSRYFFTKMVRSRGGSTYFTKLTGVRPLFSDSQEVT